MYAYPASGGGTGNYAVKTMVIEVDASYTTYNPVSRASVPGATNPDGEDVASSAFYNQRAFGTVPPQAVWALPQACRTLWE